MFFFFQPDDDPDAKKLAALLAADDVLGADFWTWSMLAEWGASLNPQEAEERIEQGYLDNPVRSELYDTLFQFHPELLTTLDPEVDEEQPHHFVLRLAELPNWPVPGAELEKLDQLAGEFQRRTVWFGCSRELKNWRPAAHGRSRAVLFFTKPEGGITAYSGDILGRKPMRPFASYLDELYPNASKVKSWVLLGRFTRLDVDQLDQILGSSRQNRPASESFRGQNAFSYWRFNDEELAQMPLRSR